MRMEQHALLDRKLWIAEKGHKKGRETCPFRAPDGFNEIGLSALERMAGTTGLEPATSAVTVSTFNDMEEHGRHCKSLEVHLRQRYCVSRCVSRRLPFNCPALAPELRLPISLFS